MRSYHILKVLYSLLKSSCEPCLVLNASLAARRGMNLVSEVSPDNSLLEVSHAMGFPIRSSGYSPIADKIYSLPGGCVTRFRVTGNTRSVIRLVVKKTRFETNVGGPTTYVQHRTRTRILATKIRHRSRRRSQVILVNSFGSASPHLPRVKMRGDTPDGTLEVLTDRTKGGLCGPLVRMPPSRNRARRAKDTLSRVLISREL